MSVLSGSIWLDVAVLFQQYAVESVLVVDMTTGHNDVLAALIELWTVTDVGHPQELPVLQAEAVAVGVDDLHVVARLLTAMLLA